VSPLDRLERTPSMTRRTTGVSAPDFGRLGPVISLDGPTDVVGGLTERSRQERSGVWLRFGVEESDLERSGWFLEVAGRVGNETDRDRSARLQLVFDRSVGEGVVARVPVFPAFEERFSRHSGMAVERVELDEGAGERSVAPTLPGCARSGLCLLAVRRPESRLRTPIWRSPSAGETARLTPAERVSRRATKSVTSVSSRPLNPLLSARVAFAFSLSMAAVELFHVSRVKPRVSVVMTPWGTSWRVPRRVSAAPDA